jgi:hypothetical protein
MIAGLARRVARRLADIGVIGRFAIDFVVARTDSARWTPFAVELNLRIGGTTHPYQTLAHLVGGHYDSESASFITAGGRPRHYVATDYLLDPRLRSGHQRGAVDPVARRAAVRPPAAPRNRVPHAQLAGRARPSRHHGNQRQPRESERAVRPRPSGVDRPRHGAPTRLAARTSAPRCPPALAAPPGRGTSGVTRSPVRSAERKIDATLSQVGA